MREVAGKPLLQYQLERLNRCQSLQRFIILTSTDPSDDPIAEFCSVANIDCFRGDLHNVAQRFILALEVYPFDAFVRLCADSPLIDPDLVDKAVTVFQSDNYDMVTNVMPRTYPHGESVEILAAETFKKGFAEMHSPAHFEHVTSFFYENHQKFRIYNLALPCSLSEVPLSVDTKADLEAFSRIVAAFERPHWDYGLTEILEIYQQVTSVQLQ